MTRRARLPAVLQERTTHRLPRTTLVDRASLQHFPIELQGTWGLGCYRHLGCDAGRAAGERKG